MLETNEYIRLANMLREVARRIAIDGDEFGVYEAAGVHHAADIIEKLGGEVGE